MYGIVQVHLDFYFKGRMSHLQNIVGGGGGWVSGREVWSLYIGMTVDDGKL